VLGFVDDTVRRVRLFFLFNHNKTQKPQIHKYVQLVGPHKRAERERERERENLLIRTISPKYIVFNRL